MKNFKYMIALVALATSLSCQNSDMDFNVIDIDVSDTPDLVLDNTRGTLYYCKELKGWYISCGYPGMIDSRDNCLIVNMPDKKFPLEEGKEVVVSGYCYHIPHDAFNNNDLYEIHGIGGLEWYYIKITYLK